MLDRKAIKERCEKSSGTDWTWEESPPGYLELVRADGKPGEYYAHLVCTLEPQGGLEKANADFIFHAKKDIPALLDYIQELEQRLNAWWDGNSALLARVEKLKAENKRLREAAETLALWMKRAYDSHEVNNPYDVRAITDADILLAALKEGE